MTLNDRIQKVHGMGGQKMVRYGNHKEGPAHEVVWYSDVYIGGSYWATGYGRQLHSAEEDAARQVLQIVDNPYDSRSL
ncbi:hypothetical protein CONPUDRAFT_154131 [Coniophora puteana RWD-64-598 SS2]|uniref:DRBM domain-containing protein n=1 Tax=Coniophora puteana (strain RWD-64-598) TaxID=741705 RepID=A0A5M3MR13_CONPW|nr:uncharacterized protein CONPUDRAFT_154131 [Coniophora puteana RWD-64-598 SS2]EIW81599.1 hypothetical protein CONPUDRAFT_154131 [Coniophora puteana RWD-64-598 SS2]